ncbi:MAG: 4-hydroxythreonine-4-phosphate dehydrogenase PdxA [Alphaproteobacteria bacterium]|nr:MAG: 4-hydroxythreonine-4-phosphate dehydrogenase PdxA [Alphaproteobacteria bacterium]
MRSSTIADGLPLALTLGEPAGIGPEITFSAWKQRRERALPAFAIVAPLALMRSLRDTLAADIEVESITDLDQTGTVFDRALPVFESDLRYDGPAVAPGTPRVETAPLVLASIRVAVNLARQGKVSGMVTNPIAKSVLYKAGLRHPGHTELLAELTGAAGNPVMMLAIDGLRVVPLTIHIPLAEVAQSLSADLIVTTAETVITALRRDFAIHRPRLAVAGLNPHAGENGTIGNEEEAIIAPAIARLRESGHQVRGPVPADSLFHPEARERYDAALCMYHDQALIPLKTLDFHRGVNITLGLPIVRTSPDHGTAFDIAGQGIARPDSLIAALSTAAQIADSRARAR